jgi:hypothetical protein
VVKECGVGNKDFPFDFSITYNNKVFGIEVISKITSNSLQKMKEKIDRSGVYALILITNRVVEDFSTFQLLSDLKSKGLAGRRVYYISAMDTENIQSEIMNILITEK